MKKKEFKGGIFEAMVAVEVGNELIRQVKEENPEYFEHYKGKYALLLSEFIKDRLEHNYGEFVEAYKYKYITKKELMDEFSNIAINIHMLEHFCRFLETKEKKN